MNMIKVNSKKITGFTLIELLIVVSVIAILAAISYPSFVEQVKKTKRAAAQADLVELASYMERYYTENFKYTDAALPFTQSPKEGDDKYYDLTVSIPNDTTYTLTATPISGQQDDRCGAMTLTHTGVHDAAEDDCW